ncbi:hypothetical protein Pelo_10881 [Pelomyxa schiedti]|nr:hypothetical protein Pelo_10881 [Pelomyxa schiedti]
MSLGVTELPGDHDDDHSTTAASATISNSSCAPLPQHECHYSEPQQHSEGGGGPLSAATPAADADRGSKCDDGGAILGESLTPSPSQLDQEHQQNQQVQVQGQLELQLQLARRVEACRARRDALAHSMSHKRVKNLRKLIQKKVNSALAGDINDLDSPHTKTSPTSESLIEPSNTAFRNSGQRNLGSSDSKKHMDPQCVSRTDIWKYLDPNPQLKDVPQGPLVDVPPEEKEIRQALRNGDFASASNLSDRLSESHRQKQLVAALNCKAYDDAKAEEELHSRKLKRPRLQWGFESKERWERKGNM